MALIYHIINKGDFDMKRLISAFLCIILIASVFCNVSYANTTEDLLQQKLSVVKSRIGDTDEYDGFSSNITGPADGFNTYHFTWEDSQSSKHLRVTINQDDIITSYYKNAPDKISEIPMFEYRTSEEILDASEEFFNMVNPQLDGKYVFETAEYADLYSDSYVVYLHRIENGIKVQGNEGNMRITKDLKNVMSMYINYTPIEDFEAPDNMISVDKAMDNYTEKLGYKLIYNMGYDSKAKQRNASLNYVQNYDSALYIDALTGDVFDLKEFSSGDSEEMRNTANDKLASGGILAEGSASSDSIRFSEAELSEINKIQNLLSTSEIESVLRNNEYLDIPKDSKLSFSALQKDYYDAEKYIYILNIDNDEEFCSIDCDARTGEILNFSRYINKDSKSTEKISPEILDEKLIKYLKGLAGEYFTEDSENTFVLNNPEKDNFINAKRIVNGIEFVGNGASANIDPYSGKLSYYVLNYHELEFPDPGKAITFKQAYDKLFETYEYKAVYIPVVSDDKTHKGKLVYDFENYEISMDALSGKLYNFTDSKDKITDYTDISGHYAENIINKLKCFGIGFTGGEYKPDEIITQGEFVTLLAYVFRYNVTPVILKTGTDFKRAYNFVNSRELIPADEIDENANLTREDASVILIKAMNYEDVAKYSDIFVPVFEDVKDNIGYIAILNAMDIINGDGNGNFNPEEKLTRADAAIILYNYLIKQ